MKKSCLWTGIRMIAVGLICLAGAVIWDTPLSSLLCGFFGALVCPGAMMVYKYFKWTRLETRDSYRRHLEEEQIELRDERKEMLRNKSGRYAYILGLLVTAVSILAFSILGKLGLTEEGASRLITLYLAAFLVIQYLAGAVFYKLLEKKY